MTDEDTGKAVTVDNDVNVNELVEELPLAIDDALRLEEAIDEVKTDDPLIGREDAEETLWVETKLLLTDPEELLE